MRAAPSCKRYHNFVAQVSVTINTYQHEAYCTPCNTNENTAFLRTVSLDDYDTHSDNDTIISKANSAIDIFIQPPNNEQVVPDIHQAKLEFTRSKVANEHLGAFH